VHELKTSIAAEIGVETYRQDLFLVDLGVGGKAVREDDAEPQLLKDDDEVDVGEIVTLSVEEPLAWKSTHSTRVELCKDCVVATKKAATGSIDTVMANSELIADRHYWEVQLVSLRIQNSPHGGLYVGITRPNLDPERGYIQDSSTDGWFIRAGDGALYGNGKFDDDQAGPFEQGDRVGVLLDLNDGTLLFFKNGVQHGPGYVPGSVEGPVVPAIGMYGAGHAGKLLPGVNEPPLPHTWTPLKHGHL
jgi:hypothetical protein